jgi:hypothetical protein
MNLTPFNFELKFAYAAWVPPFKNEEESKIHITSKLLASSDDAMKYFTKIFDESISSCRIEIIFKSNDSQENEFRTLILNLINKTTPAEKMIIANTLAKRLSKITDNRNGTGLFVIIEGKKAETTRIILNRFREDEVVFSNVNGEELTIQLLTQAFSKKSRYYKLAVFEDLLTERSFWKGFAIDKQKTSGSAKEISDYWIKEFLDCEPSVNSIQGTKSLSRIIKSILKTSNTIEEKELIISGILALKNRGNQYTSIETFCDSYLNTELKQRIMYELNDNYTFQSSFEIDNETYTKELGNKITSLESGVIVTAPTFLYEQFVNEEDLGDGITQLTVKGKVKDKKLSKVIN